MVLRRMVLKQNGRFLSFPASVLFVFLYFSIDVVTFCGTPTMWKDCQILGWYNVWILNPFYLYWLLQTSNMPTSVCWFYKLEKSHIIVFLSMAFWIALHYFSPSVLGSTWFYGVISYSSYQCSWSLSNSSLWNVKNCFFWICVSRLLLIMKNGWFSYILDKSFKSLNCFSAGNKACFAWSIIYSGKY